ncbi:MAG: tetratricopeptide repeat protein [Methylococcaceae bacterium]
MAKKTGATVSPVTYKKLKKSEQLLAKESYKEALALLQGLLGSVVKQTYDEATVLKSLAYVHTLQGHYKQAAVKLEQCISLEKLPEDQQQQTMYDLGQLYLGLQQYQKAIRLMEPWVSNNNPKDGRAYILLANAHAQLKQYRPALTYAKKANRQTKKINEAWYQLELALHYELHDYPAMIPVLTTLLKHVPDKTEYWNRLSSVHQQLNQNKKAASIKQLAYKKGLLKNEKELLNLVDLLLYAGLPFQAAELMQFEYDQGRIKRHVKYWERLANAWTQAREFDQAVVALEKASSLTKSGNLYHRLGHIYVQQEQWAKAISSLQKAIQKGDIKNTGQTYLLLGMSHYELQQKKQARQAFERAGKYKKTTKAARQWLQYLAGEKAEG